MYAVRAAQIGLAEGVTWLLHIDADELFYDSNAQELDGSAAKVFEALSRKEFTHASFFNDEILPETASYTDKKQLMTPFHQRTLFKVRFSDILYTVYTVYNFCTVLMITFSAKYSGNF